MSRQIQREAIPAVEEQTELDTPIKIRWSGKDRRAVRRSLRAAADDGLERGVAFPVMTRQKTQIVIKTEEELEAFYDSLTRVKLRVRRRLERKIQDQLPDDDEDSNEVVRYDPQLQDHPCYVDTEVDFAVGDCVELLAYGGSRVVRDDDGNVIGQEKYNPSGTSAYYVVRDVDGFRVNVAWGDKNGSTRWVPRDRIIGTSVHQKAKFEYRREKNRREQERIAQRKETDLDVLMEEVIKPHARKKVNEVWPGGTVDVDEISWFWNTRLSNCAGKAYWGTAVPQMAGGGHIAIGLAPGYYYQHGIEALLEVVRHELIHCWEYEHPDANGGHGPKFKQWLDDMDTHRHCKNWSK